jgi:hypothetical protein
VQLRRWRTILDPSAARAVTIALNLSTVTDSLLPGLFNASADDLSSYVPGRPFCVVTLHQAVIVTALELILRLA